MWVVLNVSLHRNELLLVGMTSSLNPNENSSLHRIEAEGHPINDCKHQNWNSRSDVASSYIFIDVTDVVATILEEKKKPVNQHDSLLAEPVEQLQHYHYHYWWTHYVQNVLAIYPKLL